METPSLLALFVFLFLFIAAWGSLYYLLSPHLEAPDASARITGNCGDTMELQMRIKDNIARQVHHWTDGCTMSRNCIEAASRLARGRTIDKIEGLNMMDIIEDIGRIPPSHLHCAQLAEFTLHEAVRTFRENERLPQS